MPYRVPFDVPRWTYADAMRELGRAQRFGMQPLLETVTEMLDELARPDASFESLQITGTNGKTSTSRYTAAILRGEGLRVALFTSPDLVSVTERMEIDGAPAAMADVARGIAAAASAGRRVNARRRALGMPARDVTHFDLLTVAACVVFAEARVDVAVLEVGLGGRWDATSAVCSIRSVAVTGVGLDHTRVLGDTVEAIAAEKSAVMQKGRTCVLGAGTAAPKSVEDVFVARADELGIVPVLLRPDDVRDVPGEIGLGAFADHPDLPRASYHVTRHPRRLGDALLLDVVTPCASYGGLGALKPAYQAANIACAVTLAEQFLGRVLSYDALVASIVSCPTPGRFDVVRPDPLALIDACHNPQGVRAFLDAMRAIEPERSCRPTLLAAVLADKDVEGIVGLLAGDFSRVVVTQTPSPRALSATRLAECFERRGANVVGVYDSVADALARLEDVAFVACGSITLAGAVIAAMRPHSPEGMWAVSKKDRRLTAPRRVL